MTSVPCARMLVQYWRKHGDFRDAFCAFYTDITEGYDKARAAGYVHDADVTPDIDHQATAAACTTGAIERQRSLREQLLPLHTNHVTLRQIAEASDLSLRETVLTLLNTSLSRHWQAVVDLEEDMLALAASGAPMPCADALARKHGLTTGSQCPKILAKRHGITLGRRSANENRRVVRNDAIRMMVDEGLSPKKTLPQIHAKYADDPTAQKLTLDLLYVWKSLELKRRREVAA